MNRFQRHTFTQVSLSVAMALGLFIFVMVMGVLIQEVFPRLADGQISWGQFFALLPIVIPGILPYALPMGFLTGILIVLGRMSAQNEILAMKAAGISLWRICSPIFLIALAGVALSIVINFEHAPRANDALKRIVGDAVRDNPTNAVVPGEFVSLFKPHIIYAKSREGSRLKDVWIWQHNPATGQIVVIIHASEAVISADQKKDLFRLNVTNATLEEFNRNKSDDFSEPVRARQAAFLPVEMSLTEILKKKDRVRKLRHYTLTELLELRRTSANLGEADIKDPQKVRANRIAIQVQIQTYLANAFGILSMTMLAIPLGLKTSRSETFVNVALALALALVFYVLTVAVSWIKDPAYRADVLVWMPNFLFQAIGTRLLFKAAKQ